MEKEFLWQIKAAEILYFTEELKQKVTNISQFCSRKGIDLDERSLRNWKKPEQAISHKKYKLLKTFLCSYFEDHEDLQKPFFSFLIEKGKRTEFFALPGLGSKTCKEQLFGNSMTFSEKLEYLESPVGKNGNCLLSTLSIPFLLSCFDSQIHFYGDYFRTIGQSVTYEGQHFPWIHLNEKQVADNYRILDFCDTYKVLLLINQDYTIDEENAYVFELEINQFMKKENVQMVLVFTEQEDISFHIQDKLMDGSNLFCEYISEEQLSQVTLNNLARSDLQKDNMIPSEFLYATAILRRLGSYFPVIRNEILFDEIRDADYPKDKKDFAEWFDKIVLKRIYDYRYMTRHSIYFERNRVKSALFQLQKNRYQAEYGKKEERSNLEETREEQKQNYPDKNLKHEARMTSRKEMTYVTKNKLDLVVEICAPNTFTSLNILEYAKEFKLFSTSKRAVEALESVREKPENVHFHLGHISPEVISRRYEHELKGKCDMVVMGFGMGSSVENIREYLRHVNSWLKQDGVIVISFVNSESVLLSSNTNMENIPIRFADYWEYHTRSNLRFLNRIHPYPIHMCEQFLRNLDMEYSIQHTTYPFLMGLTNLVKDDKTREIIRTMDKHNAVHQTNGHYITLLGFKSCNSSTKENRESIYVTTRRKVLDQNRLWYEVIEHSDSIDAQNLKKNLIEKKIDLSKNSGIALLKTVVLKAKTKPSKAGNEEDSERLIYCILPESRRVRYNPKYYSPLGQKQIMKQFGRGTLSPAVVFEANKDTLLYREEKTDVVNEICLIGLERDIWTDVIFTSGKSNESFCMHKGDFVRLIKDTVASGHMGLIQESDLV